MADALTFLKPTLLVSRCLLGDPVRYDGAHKTLPGLTERLSARFTLQPLCPEIYLGVPRPPMQRQQLAGAERLVRVGDGAAVAPELPDHCRQLAQRPACAALLKARSPSCGIGSSPLFDGAGRQLGLGDGVLVQALRRAQPELLLVDEEQVAGPQLLERLWRLALLASQDWPAGVRDMLVKADRRYLTGRPGLAQLARELGQDTPALRALDRLRVGD